MNKKIPLDMISGYIHHTKYGDLEIVSYTNSRLVIAKFKGTGFQSSFLAGNIRKGEAKDKLYKSIFNFGFVGVGPFKTRDESGPSLVYSKWKSMIDRCYSGKAGLESYADCYVCDEWSDFQVFAVWFFENHPKDGGAYELDKDLLVSGNKIYSPSTCLFITRSENMLASRAKIAEISSKNFLVTHPILGRFEIKNLSEFCSKRNINYKKLHATSTKRAKTHKGWTAQLLS